MKSFLARRNPLAVLAVTLGLLAPALVSFDHPTPLVFMGLALFNLFALGRVRLGRAAAVLGPLSLLPFGLLALNLLFHREGFAAGLRLGSVLFLRAEALIVISMSFALLVRPLELVNALMQQLGMPARIGYSIYAGWNALPLLRRDMAVIGRAHAIRSGGRKRGPRELPRSAVTLLAGAVRHAERLSLSMSARGLEQAGPRSFYRESRWTAADTAYSAAGCLLAAAAFLVLLSNGAFIFDLG